MKKRIFTRIVLTLTAFTFLFLNGSCLMTRDQYVSTEHDIRIEAVPSESHKFSYVRAYNDNGDFVLYGKLDHLHEHYEKGGHVDLSIIAADGGVIESASLPVVNRGNRRKGWNGAHFRVRLDRNVPNASNIRLLIHDADCLKGPTFDCSSRKPGE